MADKFIPTKEIEFENKAARFAKSIGREPERFGISRDDADLFASAVEDYRAKRQAAGNRYTSSGLLRDKRDAARAKEAHDGAIGADHSRERRVR